MVKAEPLRENGYLERIVSDAGIILENLKLPWKMYASV